MSYIYNLRNRVFVEMLSNVICDIIGEFTSHISLINYLSAHDDA